MFSEYFIDKPRFAGVIAIIMVLLGCLAIVVLPISQYPQITPPQIVVSTTYPGASAQVLVDTVAVPIENQINGVEDMLYMSSTSDDNGSYDLTVTFNIGTDPDIAQVKVENRLQQVMSQLPAIVTQEGLEVKTQSANILGMLVLRSPNRTYDDLFLSNFAYSNIKNSLARVPEWAMFRFTARSTACASGSILTVFPLWDWTVPMWFRQSKTECSGIHRTCRRCAEQQRYARSS